MSEQANGRNWEGKGGKEGGGRGGVGLNSPSVSMSSCLSASRSPEAFFFTTAIEKQTLQIINLVLSRVAFSFPPLFSILSFCRACVYVCVFCLRAERSLRLSGKEG